MGLTAPRLARQLAHRPGRRSGRRLAGADGAVTCAVGTSVRRTIGASGEWARAGWMAGPRADAPTVWVHSAVGQSEARMHARAYLAGGWRARRGLCATHVAIVGSRMRRRQLRPGRVQSAPATCEPS